MKLTNIVLATSLAALAFATSACSDDVVSKKDKEVKVEHVGFSVSVPENLEPSCNLGRDCEYHSPKDSWFRVSITRQPYGAVKTQDEAEKNVLARGGKVAKKEALPDGAYLFESPDEKGTLTAHVVVNTLDAKGYLIGECRANAKDYPRALQACKTIKAIR